MMSVQAAGVKSVTVMVNKSEVNTGLCRQILTWITPLYVRKVAVTAVLLDFPSKYKREQDNQLRI